MIILNGRTTGYFWGNFTHYNNNGGASTIDLALTSCNIYEHISNFRVMPQLEISSHCKIVTEIENPNTIEKQVEKEYDWIQIPFNFNWNEKSKIVYSQALKSEEINALVNETEQLLHARLIESSGRNIQKIFQQAAHTCLENKQTVHEKNIQKTKKKA